MLRQQPQGRQRGAIRQRNKDQQRRIASRINQTFDAAAAGRRSGHRRINRGGNQAQLTRYPLRIFCAAAGQGRQPTFLMPGCTQPFGELSHEMTDSDTIRRWGQRGDRERELPQDGLQDRLRPSAWLRQLEGQLPAAVEQMPLAVSPGMAQGGKLWAQLFPTRQSFGLIGRAVEGRSQQEPRRLSR